MKEIACLRRLAILLLGLGPALPASILEVKGSARGVSPVIDWAVTTWETYPNSSERSYVDYDSVGNFDLASATLYLDYSLPPGSSLISPPVVWVTVLPSYLLTSHIEVTRLDPVSGFAPARAGVGEPYQDRVCSVGAAIGVKSVGAAGCFSFYLFLPPEAADYPAHGRVVIGAEGVEFFTPADIVFGSGFNSRTVFSYEWQQAVTLEATLMLEYTNPQLGARFSAPEPGTMLLAGGCLIGLALLGVRARRCG